MGQAGYPEEATPLGVITSQNDGCGAAFDPTASYGFGFSTIPAGPVEGYTGKVAGYDAFNVNLDESEAADYAYMVAHGASVYYRGHAVWKGDDPSNPNACTQTTPGRGRGPGHPRRRRPGGGGPDVHRRRRLRLRGGAGVGDELPLRLLDAHQLRQLPELHGIGMGVGEEASPRGIQVSQSGSAIAQVTLHMDHPFWESFAEDTPVHWDQIAAQYVG